MISKGMKKLVSEVRQQRQSNKEMQSLLEQCKNIRFWPREHGHKDSVEPIISDRKYHPSGICCFNHLIGLPRKDGKRLPMFDYEYSTLYSSLMEPSYTNSFLSNPENNQRLLEQVKEKYPHIYETFTMNNERSAKHAVEKARTLIPAFPHKVKHLWVKKATGLGVTEFFLRFMLWLCLRNDDMKGAQMVIITGPNQELAIKLIKRMKAMLEPHGIRFDTKETTLEINGCTIEAYPSNHIDAFRSLTNPKFILLDEADFFRKNEQEDVRSVAERYIAKSDPYIVMVSTPNRPDGLFARIEKEPHDKTIYKKVVLDYTYGLGKIYTNEEIEKAKKSPSFPREYEVQYSGVIGNVISPQSIEKCQLIEYNPLEAEANNGISIGIDAGFGSSNFAIIATRFRNERIEVIFAEEFNRPDFVEMVDIVMQIQQKHGDATGIFVDAANPEIWQSVKKRLGEEYKETYVKQKLEWCRKHNLKPEDYMIVVPTPFNLYGPKMLQHTKAIVEGDDLIAIDKRFDKLLTALRTAQANEYRLDKEATSYHDLFDALRLALQPYHMEE